VRYRAQLARDEAFNDVVMDGVFDASPARFTGLADGDYWLRVRAIDDAGLEGYDAARAFALRARPEPPRAAPPRAATLSWEQVPAAAGYRLQVSRDAAFKDLAGEWDSPAPAVDTGLPPGLIGGGSPPCAVRASGARGATSSPSPCGGRRGRWP
jgi:hypothetical protein